MGTQRLAPALVGLGLIAAVAALATGAPPGVAPTIQDDDAGPTTAGQSVPDMEESAGLPVSGAPDGSDPENVASVDTPSDPPRVDCTNGTSKWVIACGYQPGPTAVAFGPQTADGNLSIRAVNLSGDGFVAVHRMSYLDGAFASSLVGVSGPLSPGLHTDVSIDGDVPPGEERVLVAVAYRDSDGDGRFDFVASDGAEDRPYTNTYAAGIGNVTDEAGKVIGDTAVVSASNAPPRADAGPDRTVAPGRTVELDATGSTDSDGDSLTYSWSVVGSSDVRLSDPATESPTFTAPTVEAETVLTFEVTVDDGTASATDRVRVAVVPDEGDPSVDRRVPRDEVSPGSWMQVTLTVEFDRARKRASILDGFEGPVEAVSIDSITSNGSSVPDDRVVFEGGSRERVTVALSDVEAGATVTVSYSVLIDPNASVGTPIAFTGSDEPDVSAGERTAEFGTDTATVADGPVARADTDDDGTIDDDELRAAIVSWSDGEFTDGELRWIVVAWSAR